jgi:hypothetical protein
MRYKTWNRMYIICKGCSKFLYEKFDYDYFNHKWKCSSCQCEKVFHKLKTDVDYISQEFDELIRITNYP